MNPHSLTCWHRDHAGTDCGHGTQNPHTDCCEARRGCREGIPGQGGTPVAPTVRPRARTCAGRSDPKDHDLTEVPGGGPNLLCCKTCGAVFEHDCWVLLYPGRERELLERAGVDR